MQKDLIQLFNSVARKSGRTNQTITENDLRKDALSRNQEQMLQTINDEIEMLLMEHNWLTTRVFKAELETASPPDEPTTSSDTGNSISGKSERTLYVKVTYDWPHGETTASDVSEITIAQDEWLKVTGPSGTGRAEYWNLYVGENKDDITEQATQLSLGTDWHEENDGPLDFSTDIGPPAQNVDQYALHGTDNIPVDYKWIEGLILPDTNDDIEYKSDLEFKELRRQQSNPSRPAYYRITRLDDKQRPIIQLHPSPSKKYKISYEYNELFTRLSEPHDHAPIEDQLVILAAVMTHLDMDGQEYQLTVQRYQRVLENAKGLNNPTNEDMAYGDGGNTSGQSSNMQPLPNRIPDK